MLKKHSVEGFDDFKSKVEELAKEGLPLFVHFSGSKVNGKKLQTANQEFWVRNLHFLSKNSTLIYEENCRFFFGWKTRENVVV